MSASNNPAEPPADAEMKLLRFVCDEKVEIAARRRALELLDHYRWSVPDGVVFFECIRDLFARNAQTILAELPAALTRRGFPDMPCESLAQPAGLNSDSALALAEKLLQLSKPAK